MHTIVDNLKIEQALMPQNIQAIALNTGDIDCQGAGALSASLLVGNIADVLSGSVKIDIKIEHADDDGTGLPAVYSACTDADVLNFSGLVAGLFLSIDATTKEQKRHVIDYIGGKRFVKITATPSGLTSGGEIAILTLKGNLSQKPASNL